MVDNTTKMKNVSRHTTLVLLIATLGNYSPAHAAEFSVKVESIQSRLTTDLGVARLDATRLRQDNTHIGFSVKHIFGGNSNHHLGTGIDIGDLIDDNFVGFRAIDYDYAITPKVRLGAFLGAASLNTGLPQNGYYAGFNVSYKGFANSGFFSRLGFKLERKYASGLSRDRIGSDPTKDPDEKKPDIFINAKITGIAMFYNF